MEEKGGDEEREGGGGRRRDKGMRYKGKRRGEEKNRDGRRGSEWGR